MRELGAHITKTAQNKTAVVSERFMKYPVTRFKSMAVALGELAPFILDGQHLETGRPFKKLYGMRSREVLANWLLCAVLNSTYNRSLSFCSDPTGGDGIIHDMLTGDSWPTEHVMVPMLASGQMDGAEDLIMRAIAKKREKGGAAYAEGKTLIVFLNVGAGIWHPNKVAQRLPKPLYFSEVWVVGLHAAEDGEYTYNVACLDITMGDAPTFRVRLNKNFDAWEVEKVQ
jgi:hypothetical protein